jgi:hypothetical protein
LQLSDPSLREYFLWLRGLNTDYTPRFKTENRKIIPNEPRSFVRCHIVNSSLASFDLSDTEEAPYAHTKFVDDPENKLLVTIPSRCFKFAHDARDEDILGDAGGEEDGMRQSTYDDQS